MKALSQPPYGDDMSQMKAVQLHAYGGPDVLIYEDAPRPIPGEDQVLIRVYATSVNHFDLFVRAGYMQAYMPLPFPIILGSDIAGVIEAVGSEVNNFRPGDQVYAYSQGLGAYAEFAILKASDVALSPQSIDAVHAAAIPNVTLAAWQALFDQANLTEGQTVLVHAAAGGVGHVACQLAKWQGAKVIGTASYNFEFCQDLNVDQTINYDTTSFEDELSGLDVVFDNVGGDTYERSAKVLKPGGVLVSTVKPAQGGPSEEIAAAYDVRQEMVIGRPPIGETLTKIAELIDAGHITPHVSNVLPLSDVAKAHAMIESGHTRGKIVLRVAQ